MGFDLLIWLLPHDTYLCSFVFITFRQIARDTGIFDTDDMFWWGLSKSSDTSNWTYVDGKTAQADDIHWGPSYPHGDANMNCAALLSSEGNSLDLLTTNALCTNLYHGICEYKCESVKV